MNSTIVTIGKYSSDDVEISYAPIPITRSVEAIDYINEKWEQAQQKNLKLFAGNLINVQKNNVNSKKIILQTNHTTYDDFYITKNQEFCKKFPNETNANPLSVGCVLITNDNYLVFGIRSDNLAIAPGNTTLPSGMVDDNDIVNSSHIDVFRCIKREIEEEIGVKSNEINELFCIGLVNNIEQKQVYLPFFGRTNLSYSQIDKRENDGELKKILKIENDYNIIHHMMNDNKDLSDICFPSLQMYLELFRVLNNK